MLPNSVKTLHGEIRAISTAIPRAIHSHLQARNPVIDSNAPVILAIPGIGSPAFILRPLVEHLKQEGHNAHSWGNRTNLGPTHLTFNHMERLLRQIFEQTNQPIIGVGHSLGALYHLHFSRVYPERYSHVIGLAGPCELNLDEAHTHTNIAAAFTILDHLKPFYRRDLMENWQRESDRPPNAVPKTMIIAARDGIVSPFSCELPDHPNNLNLYVDLTHGGLLDDPIVHELTEHLVANGNQAPIPPHLQRHLLTREQVSLFQKTPPPTVGDIVRGTYNFARTAIHR